MLRILLHAALGAAMGGVVGSLSAAERLQADDVSFERDVVYGTGGGETLRLDLARPKGAGGPRPVIVYLHGGGWSGGDRNQHLGSIKQAARRGYVSATVSYRFAPKYVWPAQIEDCKCAIRFLRAHADRYGLDPQRVAVVGFSAGGHLAMLLGAMDTADGHEGSGGWAEQASKVQAVVSYFGPTDLAAEYPAESAGILKRFIGGTKEEKAKAYRDASPLTYVSAGDAPMLLFQGTKDRLVPYPQAFGMAEALTKAGVAGRVEILVGADHGWRGAESKRTTASYFEFLATHLEQKGSGR